MARLSIICLALVMLLSGCSQPSAQEPPASTAVRSRGCDATLIPDWVKPGPQRQIAEFVATAATPDTRIDQIPSDALKRAADQLSPELADELGDSFGWIGEWERLKQRQGYVSVEFSNIIGDELQAAPNPTVSSRTDESIELEVFFTRILRADGYRPTRETQPVVWRITLTDDQVTGLATVTTTA